GGARALPLRGGASRHRDLAIGKDAHGHALERPQPRALHVVGDTDAEVAAFGARFRLARMKALVVGESERAPLTFRKISARVDERLAIAKNQSDGIGHLLGSDHVASTQLGAIDLELAPD